jgi:hypothetical protein
MAPTIRNQKKGRGHIQFISQRANFIKGHSVWTKTWNDCLREAMEQHRNCLWFIEKNER